MIFNMNEWHSKQNKNEYWRAEYESIHLFNLSTTPIIRIYLIKTQFHINVKRACFVAHQTVKNDTKRQLNFELKGEKVWIL